jgi:hypothetical protein
MKTLKKTLMTGCMALAIVCMTAPLGHTQAVTPIGQCSPGSADRVCVDIKGNGESKPAVTLPKSPATEPELAIGQCSPGSANRDCVDIKNYGDSKKAWKLEDPYIETERALGLCPAWSHDGVCVGSEATVCPKCGIDFPIDAGIKSLENQP